MSDVSEMNITGIEWQGTTGIARQADRRWVEFYAGAKLNKLRSQNEGRPIYETVAMVKIIHPGEKDVHISEVRDHHKYQFPRQWAAFEQGQVAQMDGTPIDVLYPNDAAMVAQFKALHILTVEALEGLTEQGIARLGMGGRQHVERAKKFVEAARGMAGAHKMQAELDAEIEKREALENKLALMERQLAAMAEGKRGPGRPRRDEDGGT